MRTILDRLTERDIARFHRLVLKTPGDGCWTWTGGVNHEGYGRFYVTRVQVYAHRLAYALAMGEEPGAKLVCHRCDNPGCCRPGHLFVGTHSDNMADMARKGRARPGTRARPETAARGEASGQSKLTEEKVRVIRSRPDETQRALAVEFGVCPRTIKSIRERRTWANVH